MEDITRDHKYDYSETLRKLLELNFDPNAFSPYCVIDKERKKVYDAAILLKMELIESEWEVYNIDAYLKIRTKDFISKLDYANNLISCLKLKDKFSSIILNLKLHDRYFLYVSSLSRYYDIYLEERNFHPVGLSKSHLRIVV